MLHRLIFHIKTFKIDAKVVPCGPRGTLHDYVPWYFAPRSPMLYTINKGNVEGYSQGQRPLIYLVSTVETVRDNGSHFVFTDGHGIQEITNFFTDLSDLEAIDWEIIKARIWRNTVADPDRVRRRNAEFLVYRSFDYGLIESIGVFDVKLKVQVQTILQDVSYSPRIDICRHWYF